MLLFLSLCNEVCVGGVSFIIGIIIACVWVGGIEALPSSMYPSIALMCSLCQTVLHLFALRSMQAVH